MTSKDDSIDGTSQALVKGLTKEGRQVKGCQREHLAGHFATDNHDCDIGNDGNKDGNYKQLLDEVFVISRIIEVEVGVISRSRRLRLITLTETSIILNITKTESNNCFIIH